MENLFISIVCITLFIIAASTMSLGALNSVNTIAGALNQQTDICRDRLDTGITCTASSTTGMGSTVTVDLDNTGNSSLANFSSWDVVVRYGNGDTRWIPYSVSTPGWSVASFFFQGGCGKIWSRHIQPGRNYAFNHQSFAGCYGEYN